MKKITKQNNNGFSLVEMLVSVSILLLVIAGPMTVTSRASKSSTFATEQVQAFFLAQEGLELAQKMRDDLLVSHFNAATTPWASFKAIGTCFAGTGCGIEWGAAAGQTNVIACPAFDSCRLYRKPASDRSRFTYTAAGNTPTLYFRKIYFSNVGADAVLVRSVVTWRTGSLVAEQRVETQTYLYNIYATP